MVVVVVVCNLITAICSSAWMRTHVVLVEWVNFLALAVIVFAKKGEEGWTEKRTDKRERGRRGGGGIVRW